MDHARANLMDYSIEPIQTITIECAFTHEIKEDVLEKGESMMLHKQKQQQSAYYKKLGEAIIIIKEQFFKRTNRKGYYTESCITLFYVEGCRCDTHYFQWCFCYIYSYNKETFSK